MSHFNLMRVLKRLLPDARGVALIEFALTFPFLFLILFGGIEITRLLLIQQRLERSGYVIADITTQYLPPTQAGLNGEISPTEMRTNVFPQMTRVMGTTTNTKAANNPGSSSAYGSSADQAIIVTSIRKIGGDIKVQWQMASTADTLSGCDSETPANCVKSIVNGLAPSAIGQGGLSNGGGTVSFPADEAAVIAGLPEGSNMIVSEVFFHYRPILRELLQGVGQVNGHGFMSFNFYLHDRYYIKRTYFAPRNGDLLSLTP